MLHLRLVELGHAAALLPDLVWGGRPPTVALRPLLAGHSTRTVVRRERGQHPAIRACRRALAEAAGVRGSAGSTATLSGR